MIYDGHCWDTSHLTDQIWRTLIQIFSSASLGTPSEKIFLIRKKNFEEILHFDGKQIWNCVWLHQVNKIVQSSNLWLEVLTPEWQSNQLMTLQSPMTKCRLIFLTPTFTAPAPSLHPINKNRKKEDRIIV